MTLLATPALVRSKVASILGAIRHARIIAIEAKPYGTQRTVSLPGNRVAVVLAAIQCSLSTTS